MKLFAPVQPMLPDRLLLKIEKLDWKRYSSTLGLLAIACAATLWAIAGVVARQLFDAGVTPNELAAARAVITVLGLLPLSRSHPKPRRWLDWRIFALGVALALVTVCYYVAIARLSVAVALVIQYLGIGLVVLAGSLRSRTLPSFTILGAVVAALLGISLITGIFSGNLKLDSLGLIAAGLSALFFASYTLLSEAVVHTYGAIGLMFRAFLVSSLFWVAFQLTQGFPQMVFTLHNVPGILFVGIGGTLVPFCLMCWAIQQVNAQRGAIAATLEPVIAAVLAWIWLGQTLNSSQILGSLLVLGAVLSLQLEKSGAQ